VFVTTGLIRYAVTDDALAIVLGHEYAHDVLHHRQRLDRHGFARAFLGQLGSTPASLMTAEKEADYVGLYLAARAGYDISAAPEFWRRLAADYGDAWYVRWSHPGSLERAAALEAARAEIQQKIKAREPLVPNSVR
jgi:predicted Zn-dependent protease